jgi:cellulose synthase/poly-beta-1,6-N-acetylglucosamine synthase-like glycosyltransferase
VGSAELATAFWLSALLAGWAWVGYPLSLVLRRRWKPAPEVRKAPFTPRVSVLIVAHNEGHRIAGKIRNCLSLDYPRDRLEVVVASDGSTDDTEDVVEGFRSEGVRLVRLPGPRGKAAAIEAAVPVSTGEVLLLCDARQELESGALRALVDNLADPSVGAASGELCIRSGASAAAEGVGFYWRYEKWVRRLESQVGSTVGVTGAIYVVRRELLPRLDPRTILDDVAVPMGVVRAGRRVVFESSARAFDEPVEEAGHEFRRKVRTLAGNYQLVALHPGLLDPRRNPLFFSFLSHKLARLLVPWCLVMMLGTSLALALGGSPVFALLAGAQAIFGLLAVVGGALHVVRRRVAFLSVPYAVALLHLAAAFALVEFVRGRQTAAWRSAP